MSPVEAMALSGMQRALDGHPPDGAWHHQFVVEAGKLGLVDSKHGAADRWDWGVMADSLFRAQNERWRREALLASMLPAQRAALWADPSPEAAELRRLAR